jgi:hypothetical protein
VHADLAAVRVCRVGGGGDEAVLAVVCAGCARLDVPVVNTVPEERWGERKGREGGRCGVEQGSWASKVSPLDSPETLQACGLAVWTIPVRPHDGRLDAIGHPGRVVDG